MELVTLRLPRRMVERLRALARYEAARRNEDVSWTGLARETLEERLEAEWDLEPEAGAVCYA